MRGQLGGEGSGPGALPFPASVPGSVSAVGEEVRRLSAWPGEGWLNTGGFCIPPSKRSLPGVRWSCVSGSAFSPQLFIFGPFRDTLGCSRACSASLWTACRPAFGYYFIRKCSFRCFPVPLPLFRRMYAKKRNRRFSRVPLGQAKLLFTCIDVILFFWEARTQE